MLKLNGTDGNLYNIIYMAFILHLRVGKQCSSIKATGKERKLRGNVSSVIEVIT